jgi:glutathione synthase/RimK-type ligase-like ATP-grasp enzyme
MTANAINLTKLKEACTDMDANVLIVSQKRDFHAQAVASALMHDHDVNSCILSMEDFPENFAGSVRFNENSGIEIKNEDEIIDFSTIKSVWWRRPAKSKIPYFNNAFDSDFLQIECDHFLQGAMWSHPCLWVNDPMSNRLASRKIVQLTRARNLGLNIPPTLITNNPIDAKNFIMESGRKVVFKRTGTSSGPFTVTTVVNKENIDRLESIKYSPTTFQEYIEPDVDLRIIWIADELYSVSIDSKSGETPIDSRLDNSVRFEKTDLPIQVADKLSSLMKNLGLIYGAIDMRIGLDGKYYFLEVNPAGQFIYLELKTGIPLVKKLSDTLASGLGGS